MRAALGASRGRLARQVLAESAALALVAGAVGLGVSWWSLPALIAFVPAEMPRVESVRIDGVVLVFTIAVAFVTATLAGLASALSSARTDPAFAEGRSLLGTAAPEWAGLRWIQGGPTTLASLRGKVVLLRFWLVGCPYCTRSAPALRELWQRHKDQGLVVVGLHHPKSQESEDPAEVARAARALGFEFPIATDNDWTTIRAYGVGRVFRRFTSVSVLIDRGGVIRFVHDGGEFHRGGGPTHAACNAAFEALEAAIADAVEAAPQAARSRRSSPGERLRRAARRGRPPDALTPGAD